MKIQFGSDTSINPTRGFMLGHIGFDEVISKAKGGKLISDQGAEYLDFLSQYGALPFGHNPDFIVNRIKHFFSNQEPSMVQPLVAPEAERLAERLIALSPLSEGYCTFCNSGAETVEIAIKISRAHTQRQRIVATKTGFHGKTLGAGSATGNPKYSQPFLSDTCEFIHVEVGDVFSLESCLSDNRAAALVLELVQGEGGMLVVDAEYLKQASILCKKYETLLVIDEVQTGMGRLGSVFGLSQYEEVDADIICVAKALGGGIASLGAVLCKKSVWSESFGFYHSSTFANNNFSCAIGNEILSRLLDDDEKILKHVKNISVYLYQQLSDVVKRFPKAFKALRGKGLMLGVVLNEWPQAHSYFLAHASYHGLAVPLVCGYLLNRHKIITAPVFNHSGVVRIEPNLTVTYEEVDRLINGLIDVGHLITEKRFVSLLSYMFGLSAEEVNYTEKIISADPIPVLPPATGRRLGSFAFLIHPTLEDDLIRIMPESLNKLESNELESLKVWMRSWFDKRYEPAPVFHAPAIINAQGDYVEGWLISCPLTPERMMRLKRHERETLMEQYFNIAEQLGVDRVGLGAFTSIITRGGTELPTRKVDVTTGNSLTGIVSAEGLAAAVVNRLGAFDIRLAVIGAAGSVGRIAAIQASRYFSEIILFGNPRNPSALTGLNEVRGEILWRAFDDYINARANSVFETIKRTIDSNALLEDSQISNILSNPTSRNYLSLIEVLENRYKVSVDNVVRISVCLEIDLRSCGAIISATSNGASFIAHEWIGQNAVICDAARPSDIAGYVDELRPDIYAFEGGLLNFPHPIAFGKSNILGFRPEINLACLSETIVLSMSATQGDRSIGKELNIVEAREIYHDALEFGFSLPIECYPEPTGYFHPESICQNMSLSSLPESEVIK